MSSEMVAKLEPEVKDLEEKIDYHLDKADSDYLDFLESEACLAQSHYEEQQMARFLRERRDGTSIDWHSTFEDKLEEIAKLKSFALEIYAGHTQPPFDMGDLLEQWSTLTPSVRSALAWFAGRCSGFRQRAESSRRDVHYHQVTQEEAPSTASLGS